MNKSKFKYLLLYAFLFCASTINAQKNHAYTFPDREFKSANELFTAKQYNAAKEMFTVVYNAIPEKYDLRKEQSLYHIGICAALLYHADAEKTILYFIEQYPENSDLNNLWFYLGNYYFANGSYRKALSAYENTEERLINA
jgi:tetratricopeptide (TPR) repeat protein